MKKLHFLFRTLFPLLIFYNSNGQAPSPDWVSTYNGSDGKSDNPREMFIDAQNNIYVSGVTINKKGTQDYLTVKYNPANGQQIWFARYNGPGNENDYVYGLTVDAAGFAYVTGRSVGQAGNSDYATIKYSPVNGQTLWVNRYNGTLNSEDFAKDIKVDDGGNVFVTGFANGDPNNIFRGRALVTIKYNPDGTVAWNRSYDVSPSGGVGNSIALDGSSNVYIAGESNGGTLLLKYDNSGQLLWARTTTGGYGSGAKALIDSDGNIVVVSGSEILKYDPNGTLIWQESFNASFADLKFDASNNVYVTGFASDAGPSDYMTAKYYANGGLAWSKRFNGTSNGTDIGRVIALDNSGNVYVSGYCTMGTGRNAATNYGTIKYDGAGTLQWLALYPGHAFGIGTDNTGNVYVTGETTGGRAGTDFGTLKYPSGSAATKAVTSSSLIENSIASFSLQNYPNPFNQSTTIEYQIQQEANVKVSVYDLQGKQIATLINKNQPAGIYRINFSANKLPAGTYVYKIQAGEFVETKKLIIIR